MIINPLKLMFWKQKVKKKKPYVSSKTTCVGGMHKEKVTNKTI